MGYGSNNCDYNYCPNSPGECSYDADPAPDTAGSCDCSLVCGGCTYDDSLNRCVTVGINCSLSATEVITAGGQDYTFNKYCAEYNGNDYWHYKGHDNCGILNDELGGNWINIGNKICVYENSNTRKSRFNFGI